MRVALALVALSLQLAALPAAAAPQADAVGDMPEHRAADPRAPVVGARNLLESERFWPYQVELVQAWQPPGRSAPLAAGTRGVLIRVEAADRARVDFGRHGLYDVPVGATDLVERANLVRAGELEKEAPNFVLAIGARLLDPASAPPRAVPFREVARGRAFLCVFADPGAPGFAALAQALAPLRAREGLLEILFPQGTFGDDAFAERLRQIGWTPPFAHDHLAEAYTATLLAGPASFPALLLQTPEGRILYQGRFDGVLAPALELALERALSGTPAAPPGGAAR